MKQIKTLILQRPSLTHQESLDVKYQSVAGTGVEEEAAVGCGVFSACLIITITLMGNFQRRRAALQSHAPPLGGNKRCAIGTARRAECCSGGVLIIASVSFFCLFVCFSSLLPVWAQVAKSAAERSLAQSSFSSTEAWIQELVVIPSSPAAELTTDPPEIFGKP